MKVRQFLTGVAAGAVAITLTAPAFGQGLDDVEIKTEQVGEGLYVLFGAGGNIGVSVGDDGVFLIDDQYAPLTERIIAAVNAISDGNIRFVLNTHYHGDHTGGNENLGKAGAIIVAHDNVYMRLAPRALQEVVDDNQRLDPAAIPVVTFNDQMSFHLNGDEARIIHAPNSHTDGDSIVHFKGANVIHMGDTFFNERYPFIDVNGGGSVDGLLATLGRLLEIADDDTVIIPGHGPVTNKAGLEVYRNMVGTIRDRVQDGINQGISIDEIVAGGATAEFDADWVPEGWFIGAERMVTQIYNSLTAD